jgi:hypothetical protein
MWSRPDNQDVGLEAATIERVRNSSLVKWFRAEDPTGLKSATEATGSRFTVSGRGASCMQRRSIVRTAGACTSANVGMSSAMWVRNPHAGSLRFPEEGLSTQG